jgi:MbtH protein
MFEDDDDRTYNVVVNHEEQYSIWPIDREMPLGWKAVGKSGTKQECLDHIEEVWTDMRPLSLRKKMEEMAKEVVGTESTPS